MTESLPNNFEQSDYFMRKSISSILFLSAILLSCGRTEKTGWVQPNIMETEKKNIGSLPALYPKPLTVVGAEVEGKECKIGRAHV